MLGVEDSELATAVASGDPQALAQFVERFYAPIFRFLWHACGSREDAEDLASQAFLRARSDIRGYRSEGPLAAWMYGVARREWLRHRRRQTLASLFASTHRFEPTGPPAEGLVVVQAALAKLSLGQREAFLLTEVEGLTIDEAARSLDVPAGTVKSRCHHAKRRLRELLEVAYPEVSNYAAPIPD